ncbi:transposase [Ilyonectria robusta]
MPREEPVRVSIDEIRRTLEDLDRRHARGRTPRRHGESQQTGAKPREEPRAEDRGHRPQAVTRRNTVTVPEDELKRTIAAITQQHAEERLRARAARLRAEEEASELDHQGAEEALQTQPPATPERIFRAPQVPSPQNRQRNQPPPPRRAIPHTPPSRKRLREQPLEGLLTPPPTRPERPQKRPRPSQETAQLQKNSLESILEYHESCFHAKRDASLSRSWCKEAPHALQVETSKSFYEAFTDERMLPISHCTFCYRKCPLANITAIHWRTYLTAALLQATTALQKCKKCLPQGDDMGVDICLECRGVFENGKLPKACSVNNMSIGCEHRYPRELDGLSPVEERLIALQAPFGYITKFTVDNKTPSGVSYRKHVKGHIVVFPNNVDDLVATVLPHPLLQTIENIHVSWSGANRPSPAEVGTLLQVRKSRVTAALLWLQRNNPLYRDIEINLDEIQGWQYAEGSTVPAVLMERMQREEPSAVEKTHTDPFVPNTDRGLEENRFTSIEELLTSLRAEPSDDTPISVDNASMEQPHPPPEDLHISAPGPGSVDRGDDILYETSTSGMFPLDGPAAFAEVDKLSFLAEAMRTSQTRHGDDAEPSAMMIHTTGDQPFIRVERGADFADNLHDDFFPRTFPKLFPWGRGGPKTLSEPDGNMYDASQPVQRSANHSLNYWAKYVLQRHGGRFATHPVFCFLIFNILLRSTNRRISMVRMARGSFDRLERVYRSLTADRLKRAEEEIRETRTTTDPDISFLLRELSIFGHAQPLSNETRLLMRRKIQAVNVWTGMPAIWITVNPNDINNPVKVWLSIHRLHEHNTAKELLADLRGRYDRIALSTMDPVSAAIFFHREVSLFFEKYVRTDQESVFGKISHYYATVETNDRGSLHLHGLLWLEGNMQLPSLIDDMAKPEEEEYRAQVFDI